MSTKIPVADRIASELLHWLPKQAWSRSMGWIARQKLPRPLRDPLFRGFSAAYGVDLGEIDRPLGDFDRFDDFFCRPLAAGSRDICPETNALVAPCDGVLSAHGTVQDGLCVHAKGQEYSVAGLLHDTGKAQRFLGGTFATIYLAPHNYHRVHSPLTGAVAGYRHVPGARYPVNPLSVRTIPRLFQRNERLITYLNTEFGEVAIILVAATGVGNITVSYEPALATPAGGPDRGACSYEQGQEKPIERGAELGMFHMGSTVILLFEPDRVSIEVTAGTPVRLGQQVGQLTPRKQGHAS